MIDRFGELPDEVKALFTTMRFKKMCKALRIAKLDVGPKGVVLNFAALSESRAAKLIEFLGKHPTTMKMRPDQSIFVSGSYASAQEKVSGVSKLLEEMRDKLV